MNIHFICRGNVLRSIIAEAYLKSLDLSDTHVISSGTNVNWNDQAERDYFARTLSLLDVHSIKPYAKHAPDQLNQDRLDSAHDTVVFMNQRVYDEASKIITVPPHSLIWTIVDIGEQHRVDETELATYEEEIYQEIRQKIDDLVHSN